MTDETDQAARERLPLDRILGRPEEVTFFARSAIYGIGTAVIYWFMTYEPVGTVLLGAFGGASAALSVILGRRTGRFAAPVARGFARPPTADWPFGDDPGIAPTPTLAPLQVGFGALLAALTIPFGPAMLLVAVIPIIAGALSWYRDVNGDQWMVIRRDRELSAAAAANAVTFLASTATTAEEPDTPPPAGSGLLPRIAIAAALMAALGFVLRQIWRLVLQLALAVASALAAIGRLRRSSD
jgi:hypothetical protein